MLIGEAIRPAVMIEATTAALPLASLAKDASLAAADPTIQRSEHIPMALPTVLENLNC
jgi:hypothetical protein